MSIFLKKLHSPNDDVPPIVGFIWKLEYGIKKAITIILFFLWMAISIGIILSTQTSSVNYG